MATIHVLERQQRIERPLEEVFPFYADAANLERITPPWLGFEVTTPAPIAMRVGALIEYRLRLHGIPVKWRTRIEEWSPPHRFVDAQLSGPYSLWHHTHTFGPDGENATILRDRVRYAIPFGPAGELARALFVAKDLERIFDFRRDAVAQSLGPAPTPTAIPAPACPPPSPSSSPDPCPRAAFLPACAVDRRARCSRSASRSA